jgi:predicted ABC-type exoprotein transport system permease subunit
MTILAQKHRQQAVKRRNFLPSLLVTILLWILLAGLIYFVDPGTFGAVALFFVLLFSTFLFTFSLIFGSTRRGIIASIALSLFSILAYLGVGNILNLLLIVAIAVCLELYFGHT